jgi:hypothetical protein
MKVLDMKASKKLNNIHHTDFDCAPTSLEESTVKPSGPRALSLEIWLMAAFTSSRKQGHQDLVSWRHTIWHEEEAILSWTVSRRSWSFKPLTFHPSMLMIILNIDNITCTLPRHVRKLKQHKCKLWQQRMSTIDNLAAPFPGMFRRWLWMNCCQCRAQDVLLVSNQADRESYHSIQQLYGSNSSDAHVDRLHWSVHATMKATRRRADLQLPSNTRPLYSWVVDYP